MAQMFVSHATEDAAAARAIADALKARAIDIWMAPDSIRPGQVYNEAIVAGLKSSDALCVLVSKAANASKHVQREVGLADDLGKAIVPIRIENIEPSDGLIYYLKLPQWVEWHARGVSALEPVFAMLGADRPPQQTPAPPAVLGAALIQISRIARYTAMARKVAILIDNDKVGEIGNGETATWPVAPGRHALVARMDYIKSAPFAFDAAFAGLHAFELAIPEAADLKNHAAGLLGQSSYFTWKQIS